MSMFHVQVGLWVIKSDRLCLGYCSKVMWGACGNPSSWSLAAEVPSSSVVGHMLVASVLTELQFSM